MTIFWLFIALSTLGTVSAASALSTSSVLRVYDSPWGEAAEIRASIEAGNSSPILEQLMCPALTRLNLAKKRNEPNVLAGVVVSKKLGKTVWQLVLDPDKKWWNGDTIKTKALREFLSSQLATIVAKKSAKRWLLPKYSVTELDNTVEIQWLDAPAFGPYILNDIPFRLPGPTSDRDLCTGKYKLLDENSNLGSLLQASANSKAKYKNIEFLRAEPRSNTTPSVRFSYAERQGGSPWVRLPDEMAQCERKFPLPLVTAIIWNPDSTFGGNVNFRKAMTHLMPRGALLRSAAGNLGDIVSAPILRLHPGYDRNVLVRDHNLADASKLFEEAGYIRSNSEGMRVSATKQPVIVKIVSRSKNSLVEKVARDAAAAIGIELKFLNEKEKNPDYDGVLTGLLLPWPSHDFFRDNELSDDTSNILLDHDDPRLNDALNAYSLSLTMENPDFNHLKAVHRELFRLEPISVLVQHDVCVETAGIAPSQKPENLLNPHWFSDLLSL